MAVSICPQCRGVVQQVGKFFVCGEHGPVEPVWVEGAAPERLRIFLSYGHDSNEELVRRIKADLEQRGHDVWFDKSGVKELGITHGDDWRRAITEGITKSHKFVSFLSKHSTRDPGVCRDEIVIALTVKDGNIQTILVESEQEVQPPVNIGHIQWLDMHDWKGTHGVVHSEKDEQGNAYAVGDAAWEQWYQAKLAEIVRVVESDESRRFAGEIETLNCHLKPIKSEARICQLLSKGFYGREWLFKAVENWRAITETPSPLEGERAGVRGESRSRLFWIMGAPGVGKSAFAAQLTHTRGDTVIAAQFCEWDKPDHRNAPRVVRSLAFQLATRLPDYRKLLLTLPEIAELDRKDAAELFDYLLANPLRSVINGGRQRYLIVIDALDEAGEAGRNPLVEMLARNAQRLPDWLGLVVTSRPEFDVKTPLQALNPFPLDTASESNRADIRDYLLRELASPLQNRPDADPLVEQILEKSEGVFLYAERFCDDVQQGHLSLDHPDQFPQGLGEFFCQYFQRQFPDLDNFRKYVRPAFRAILAAREPLPLEILERLFNWHNEELRDFTRPLASLFPVSTDYGSEVTKPYHKSLVDWLTDDSKAGSYFVSIDEGRKLLSQFCRNNYRDESKVVRVYSIKNLVHYLIAESNWEALIRLLDDTTFLTARTSLLEANDFFAELRFELAGFVQHELVAPIYVCSTGADLRTEREALHRHVFPDIKRRFEKHSIRIQPIDFAWATDSAPTNSSYQVMRLRGEALRAFQHQPLCSFLVILGERYGWRPLPDEISADEFRCLAHAAVQCDSDNDRWSSAEVLHRWYRLDENSVEPAYVRQSNLPLNAKASGGAVVGECPDDKSQLWQLINSVFPKSNLQHRFEVSLSTGGHLPSIILFQGSAMEQELWSGVLSGQLMRENAVAFFRGIDLPQHIENLEDVRDYFDVSNGAIDAASYSAQRELKEEMRKQLGDNAVDLPRAQLVSHSDTVGRFTTAVSASHLEPLCHQAEDHLTSIISRQINEYWSGTQSLSKDRQNLSSHQLKGSFVGRQSELMRIIRFVTDDSRLPLVVHGAAGCGKTALLIRAMQEVVDLPTCRHHRPIVRFIGATSDTTDLRSLLRGLCIELRERNPVLAVLPTEARDLIKEFGMHLSAATPKDPVIIFLDALDQLSELDNGLQLSWIPLGSLPSCVKLIVSCVSDRDENDPAGQPYVAFQRRRLPADNMVRIDALTWDEAKELLFARWLPAEGRTVNASQRGLILDRLKSEPCRQPLYLKLLLEEIRHWRSYDATAELGDGVPALLKQRIDRLSLATGCGTVLVHSALAYMLTSKTGLSIWEWWEIACNDEVVRTWAMEGRRLAGRPATVNEVPWEVWFSLYSELNCLLTHREVDGVDVVWFSNKEIADFLFEWLIAGEKSLVYHRRLAAYFEHKSLRSRPDGTKVPDVRALLELAYQSMQSSSC